MMYQSTRTEGQQFSFDQVVLKGLASDGGLYLPTEWPTISESEYDHWRSLSYKDLAFEVMRKFIGDSIPEDDFRGIVDRAYSQFRHPAVAPMVQLDSNLWVLELFQGPTLAFKDFALQFLGQLLNYLLDREGQRAVIMGATSGDTGSAAIEGCRHCDALDIFILHPHNRVSEVQRKQMTSVLSDNVYNIALEGNFDDCQQMVKDSFSDTSFLPEGRSLVAVNSINWARIMAQVVYYVYAALRLGAPNQAVSFSVPTGNFGDIFAGFVAKQMGLPVDRLIVATNKNDILARCIKTGSLVKEPLQHSLSPSMDIVVSSNFERLLYVLSGNDGEQISELQQQFVKGSAHLGDSIHASLTEQFDAVSLDDDQTVDTIKDWYQKSGYVLDPHTAIGVSAATQIAPSTPVVCLSTAHPAKFDDAIKKAGAPMPQLPTHLADLLTREERYTVLPNDGDGVRRFVTESLA